MKEVFRATSNDRVQNSSKAGESLRVLILEDVAADAELVQAELRRAAIPFIARCVDTRDAYMCCLSEFAPHIILSDFSMPSFDAMEALHLLKGTSDETPFILVTGSQSEEVAVRCMREGADDYILKSTLKRLPAALLNAVKKKEIERERARALTALRDSEEHFRSLIENALDIIIVLNADATFRYSSPSMRNLGYNSQELTGKSIFDFVSTDDAGAVGRILDAAFQQEGQARKAEFLFRHADGSWRVLEAIGKSIHIESRAAGIVLNARDITERKQAEAAIEKLAAFPRLHPNPVFELSASGQLNYWNHAAQEMARMANQSPAEILPPDIAQVVETCLRTGKSNLRRETAVANCIFSWSFFPIIPNQLVHCYALDITERLNLEAQLRQSQKMESVGQLAAGIAHDFNNVLTIIQGYAKMLLDKELDRETHDSLEQVSVAADRATNLTRQLLLFSRKQVMQVQDVDLNEIVSDVTKLLRRVLREDVTLHFNYSPNLPLIQADAGMIEQIILNLAVNARDALPEGGTLTVGTDSVEINSTHMQINPEAKPGRYVCLRISDTGTGIDPAILPHIFEPFFTTKEVGKGTGLGLATVYGIVQQHRGWIEVLTQKGRGTTFRVFLPAVRRNAQSQGTTQQENCPSCGSETILVVEDEFELRTLVCGILKRHGYDVLQAGSGPEAMPIWQEQKGKIHLLFTDMVMPGKMTGHDLADQLKVEKPGLKVIYTSGYSVETKGFPYKRGLNFLQKPFHPAALVKAVRACLDS